MELFSEVYGKYYHIINEILNEAHKEPITMQYINKMLQEKGFRDTLLTLAPRIIDNESEDSYNLLTKSNESYQSILTSASPILLTTLEIRWLKSVLMDKRMSLFFGEEELIILKKQFSSIKELFTNESIHMIGQSNDGDPYEDTQYIKYFRKVLYAVNHKKCLNITYSNAEGKTKWASYAPYRLEYSAKDDKFRLNAVQINRGKLLYHSKINIARIMNVEIIEEAHYPSNISEFIHAHKMPEPIEIVLNNDRNGFERCFVHLSNYERNAEYDEETNTCKIKIYYYDFDEGELIIKLLSYGPILKVVGPEAFKKKIVERITKQKNLFISHKNGNTNKEQSLPLLQNTNGEVCTRNT